MLWLALHLPDLPLEIVLRAAPCRDPLVIRSGSGTRAQVLACNVAARALGVRTGMAVAAAQALVTQLRVHDRDPDAEQRALCSLAAWAGQFTPCVSLVCAGEADDGRQCGLLLEVESSLRLFDGLDALCARVRRELEAIGYRVVPTCAPTPGGAWLLARAGVECRVTERAALAQALAPLPVRLLAQPPAVAETLHALGVHTLGDCLRLPRAGLARRYGRGLLEEIDRACGRLPDPRRFFVPPPRYDHTLELPAEVEEVEALLFAAHRLLLELEGVLRARAGGVPRIEVHCLHRAHPATRIVVGLSTPVRGAQHLLGLLREHLQRIELPAPVRALHLSAETIVPLAAHRLALFEDARDEAEDAHALLDRLRARLGPAAIHGVSAVPDHRPERAWRDVPPGAARASDHSALRPLWLLSEPLALAVTEDGPCLDGPLQLHAGPERIESGWWDGAGIARDYFVACNPAGARFWVFRERRTDAAWYLHGIFG